MPTAIPALRGTFGSNEYWLTTMNIGELVRNVRFPQDLPGWEAMSIEEKYQREISLKRVRDEIAPYFASDPDRFSGSLVLAVMNDESMSFEPLPSLGGGRMGANPVPQLYQQTARDMGFLILQGDEVLVPLDGQHRAKAFMFAIDGADDNSRPIAGIKGNPDLAKDQVAVILVRFNSQGARRIFNKLNRYAKPTTKADNLITDDDDSMAVITRELLGEDGIIPSRLVRIGANTLTNNAPEFTTLSTLYECNDAIVNGLKIVDRGTPRQMTAEQRELVGGQIKLQWQQLLGKVDLWAKTLSDSSENGDKVRIEVREQTLLGKPIGQLSLVRAYMLMRERCVGVSESELCERLNRIDWGVNNSMWHGVLMNPNGRVMSGRGTVNRACEFIAYLAGAKLTEEETQRLLEHIHGEGWESHALPDPVA